MSIRTTKLAAATLRMLLCASMIVVIPLSAAAQADRNLIKVYVSVLAPKTVADAFGRRIAKRFIAIQVTITNRSPQHQFLIHDVSLDLEAVIAPNSPKLAAVHTGLAVSQETTAGLRPSRNYRYELSSIDLLQTRGVAEQGQIWSQRNLALRILRATGTIAAGLIGVTTFGASYAPSVATFNGPVLSAYSEAFPDVTINQLNRLNDSAYKSNTLVPKQSAKVIVAFVEQAHFL
ncbi:MAG TPA: hypothetical protein VJS64_14560, partial [Pyrinomonadaceae bacterium]|nr:hypothetical protein [Pyrinomonadaceae bacterium]